MRDWIAVVTGVLIVVLLNASAEGGVPLNHPVASMPPNSWLEITNTAMQSVAAVVPDASRITCRGN